MKKTDNITSMDVKRLNKNRIFREIYANDKISRQDIADNLGLSLPTVNQNLKLLVDEGLIEFVGNFDSTGGRKAQAIIVKSNARSTISLNIEPMRYSIIFLGLKGDILDEITIEEPFSPDENYANRVYATARALAIKLITNEVIKPESVLGIGITVPGIVDERVNLVKHAPTLGIHNFDMNVITKCYQGKCIVMNDARAHAFADYFYSGYDCDEGKLYLMLGDGVGGAFVSTNGIRSGMNNRCGEFGHMTLHPGGELCTCGKRGCLEAYVSDRKLSLELGISLKEFFDTIEDDEADELTRDRYRGILENYLDNIAIAINNMYSMYDDEIVIGGQVANYLKKYDKELKDRLIERYSFDTDGEYTTYASCDAKLSKTGAALIHIQNFINTIG